MKLIQLVFVLVVSLLIAGCEKSESTPATDSRYDGTLVMTLQQWTNGVQASADTLTVEFTLSFQDGEFHSPGWEGKDCAGKVSFGGGLARFEDGNCACWCGCNLAYNCAGEPILGEHYYTLNGDNLTMWSESGSLQAAQDPEVDFGNYWRKEFKLQKSN